VEAIEAGKNYDDLLNLAVERIIRKEVRQRRGRGEVVESTCANARRIRQGP
jgi:hypothetical protein